MHNVMHGQPQKNTSPCFIWIRSTMLEFKSSQERHYPQAFKLAMVALLAFDVFIFFHEAQLLIKAYCFVMFLAILNGWAAAEDDSFDYGDLYLLNDAICSALYFLCLLELREGRITSFWLFSSMIFLFYILWNKMMLWQKKGDNNTLRTFVNCDLGGMVFSFFVFLSMRFSSEQPWLITLQIAGLIMWFSLLLVWYMDFYLKTARTQEIP